MVTATLSTPKIDLLEMDPWADEVAIGTEGPSHGGSTPAAIAVPPLH